MFSVFLDLILKEKKKLIGSKMIYNLNFVRMSYGLMSTLNALEKEIYVKNGLGQKNYNKVTKKRLPVYIHIWDKSHRNYFKAMMMGLQISALWKWSWDSHKYPYFVPAHIALRPKCFKLSETVSRCITRKAPLSKTPLVFGESRILSKDNIREFV